LLCSTQLYINYNYSNDNNDNNATRHIAKGPKEELLLEERGAAMCLGSGRWTSDLLERSATKEHGAIDTIIIIFIIIIIIRTTATATATATATTYSRSTRR